MPPRDSPTVTDRLGVAINRTGLHTLDVEERFEADGPFIIEIENHGESSHLYLNLDDTLSDVARIEATNHYLENGERRTVQIETRDPSQWPSDTVRGKLKIVVGHGQEKRFVDVVLDRTAEKQPVEVDPDLSKPKSSEQSTTESPVLRAVPIAVLGAIAIILAVSSVFADSGINFIIGAFSILAGVFCAVAAYYLLA